MFWCKSPGSINLFFGLTPFGAQKGVILPGWKGVNTPTLNVPGPSPISGNVHRDRGRVFTPFLQVVPKKIIKARYKGGLVQRTVQTGRASYPVGHLCWTSKIGEMYVLATPPPTPQPKPSPPQPVKKVIPLVCACLNMCVVTKCSSGRWAVCVHCGSCALLHHHTHSHIITSNVLQVWGCSNFLSGCSNFLSVLSN